MNKHPLQMILERAGYETRGYVGRGMRDDKPCLAVVALTAGDLFADVLASILNDDLNDEDIADAFRNMRVDSPAGAREVLDGRGTIYWFQGVPFTKDETE